MKIQLNIYITILCVLCCTKSIFTELLCSNLVEFTDYGDVRVGRFEINLYQPSIDSYIEVKVFVSNQCKGGLCSLAMATDVDDAYDRYRTGRSVPFTIHFRAASKDAWVKGVALKTSNGCKVICKHENDIVNSSTKAMKHALYLEGDNNAQIATCDLAASFGAPGNDPTVISTTRAPEPDEVTSAPELPDHPDEEVVDRGSWPWLAGVYKLGHNDHKFLCVGTVISTRVILSASHCFYEQPEEQHFPRKELYHQEVYVILGQNDIDRFDEPGFIQYSLSNIIKHPRYNSTALDYEADIALLITDKDIVYSDNIKQAQVTGSSEYENILAGRTGTIVFWGRSETLPKTPKLLEATTIAHRECIQAHDIFEVSESFCAAQNNDGKTLFCDGDGGSGFFINESNVWKIRGITSSKLTEGNDFNCGITKYIVFTDVAKFKPWIENEISILMNVVKNSI